MMVFLKTVFPIFSGDCGRTSDDISLTLVESCSHDHGKHTVTYAITITSQYFPQCIFSLYPFRSALRHKDVLPRSQ